MVTANTTGTTAQGNVTSSGKPAGSSSPLVNKSTPAPVVKGAVYGGNYKVEESQNGVSQSTTYYVGDKQIAKTSGGSGTYSGSNNTQYNLTYADKSQAVINPNSISTSTIVYSPYRNPIINAQVSDAVKSALTNVNNQYSMNPALAISQQNQQPKYVPTEIYTQPYITKTFKKINIIQGNSVPEYSYTYIDPTGLGVQKERPATPEEIKKYDSYGRLSDVKISPYKATLNTIRKNINLVGENTIQKIVAPIGSLTSRGYNYLNNPNLPLIQNIPNILINSKTSPPNNNYINKIYNEITRTNTPSQLLGYASIPGQLVSRGIDMTIPPSTYIPTQAVRGIAMGGSVLIPVVGPYIGFSYLAGLSKSVLEDPVGTAQGLLEYGTTYPVELATMTAVGGIYQKGFFSEENIKKIKDVLPEFKNEKQAYELTYSILKNEPIQVGILRLERLKELPKDAGTLQIIKDFIKEKGLIVGGTTAIETLRINGEALNLRRVPRDLELFDPLKRNAGTLAKELAKRLESAGKKIELKGQTIGFKGIEGHGVNFQDIGGLNLTRYRTKIYTNSEGIKIADPLSTAYNKVYDLLKKVGKGTKKARELKPEVYAKALYKGKVYIRYPKDVVGALSTAQQAIKFSLKKYSNFTVKQIPIYQEYRMLRLGQAKKLIEPYLRKLKTEEATIIPNYYTGKRAGFFSGVKEVRSYTLEMQRKLLTEKKGSTTPKIKTETYKTSSYEYLDNNGKPIKNNYLKEIIKSLPAQYSVIAQKTTQTNYPKEIIESNTLYPSSKIASYPKSPVTYNNVISPENYRTPVPKTDIYPSMYPTPNKTIYPTNYPPSYPRITPPTIPTNAKFKYVERRQISKNRVFREGYNVYGKMLKSSKFFQINHNPVTKDRAKDIGSYYVSQTLARTFQIRKAGKSAQEDYEFMFVPMGYFQQKGSQLREYKIKKKVAYETPEQYIQKSRFALNTPSEKRQIQSFQRLVKSLNR